MTIELPLTKIDTDTLPAELKFCKVDGTALTLNGATDEWECANTPQHDYEVFLRSDGAYVFHGVGDGIDANELTQVDETVNISETIVASKGINISLLDTVQAQETIVTKLN
jgi:hypothetical protein